MISKKAPVKAAAKGKVGHLVRYLLDQKGKEERVAAVLVTNCQSEDPRWAVHEMQAVQGRNQRAKGEKTYHLVISFRAGEDLPRETLAKVEDEFCAALGFADHQRVSVVHRDTDHLHVHVAINKVHPTRFTLHEPFNDYHTRAQLCRKLEVRYGLESDGARPKRDAPAHAKAAAMEAVAGVESLIGYVQRALREPVALARDWKELHEALSGAGVVLKPRGNGFVVESGGATAKASNCLRELSKVALEKRFGPYQAAGATGETTPGKAYQARPMQKEGERLYQIYQGARKAAKEAQHQRVGAALEAHRGRVQRAKAAYQVQRTIIGLTRRNAVNTVMRQLHRANLKAKIAGSYATYQAERRAVYQGTKLLAWNDWLMAQAAAGSGPALSLLQSRHTLRAAAPIPSPTPPRRPLSKPNARPSYTAPGTPRASVNVRPRYSEQTVRPAPAPSRPDYGSGASLGARLLRRAVALLQSRLGKSGGRGPTQSLVGVRDLSGVDVVYDRPRTEVLLRAHEPDRLGSEVSGGPGPTLRRAGTGAGRAGGQAGESGGQGSGESSQVNAMGGSATAAYATRCGTLRGVATVAARLIERAKDWTR